MIYFSRGWELWNAGAYQFDQVNLKSSVLHMDSTALNKHTHTQKKRRIGAEDARRSAHVTAGGMKNDERRMLGAVMKLKDQQKKIKGCFELSKSCTCHISCQTLAVMCGLQSRRSHGGLNPFLKKKEEKKEMTLRLFPGRSLKWVKGF